jgi:hypothetical protein
MLESSVVDHGFEPRYIQTKAYAISIWCFSAEHAAIAREQKLSIDEAYQLLTHGRWFSPGTPAFSTTKTARHNMAEILLKVA